MMNKKSKTRYSHDSILKYIINWGLFRGINKYIIIKRVIKHSIKHGYNPNDVIYAYYCIEYEQNYTHLKLLPKNYLWIYEILVDLGWLNTCWERYNKEFKDEIEKKNMFEEAKDIIDDMSKEDFEEAMISIGVKAVRKGEGKQFPTFEEAANKSGIL